jgi:hypothetical protein
MIYQIQETRIHTRHKIISITTEFQNVTEWHIYICIPSQTTRRASYISVVGGS